LTVKRVKIKNADGVILTVTRPTGPLYS